MTIDSSLHEAVVRTVDEHASLLVGLSHAISADPELAYAEHRAAARCADLLEQHGHDVARGVYGLQTAFAARIGTAGPHLVICAEYDALPGIGHACGHNLIAAAAVGAGLALAPLAEQADLRLTVLGTPAEEQGGGKVDLIVAGAFAGVDAALMVHPTPYDDHAPRSLAIERWSVVHHGHASHASFAPHLGRNALDGIVQGYLAVAMLRQHLRPHQQVHGIIVDGGQAPNIVPERAEAAYFLRAATLDDLDDLRDRVRACLEGAAAASGTAMELGTTGHAYEPLMAHPGLAATFSAACEALGRPFRPDPNGTDFTGSTDFGNVSQLVPGLHANLSVQSSPAVNHQHDFAAACVSEAGDRTMLDAAKALALTALEVARDPSILSRCSAGHRDVT